MYTINYDLIFYSGDSAYTIRTNTWFINTGYELKCLRFYIIFLNTRRLNKQNLLKYFKKKMFVLAIFNVYGL